MEYPEITHLYKYRSFNAYHLSILINKKVWFSKPAKLNDPFDIDIDIDHPLSLSNFRYMIKVLKNQNEMSKIRLEELQQDDPSQDDLNEMSKVINKKFRDDKKNWGVVCLCESAKNI